MWSLYNLARCYFAEGDLATAKKLFKKAIRVGGREYKEVLFFLDLITSAATTKNTLFYNRQHAFYAFNAFATTTIITIAAKPTTRIFHLISQQFSLHKKIKLPTQCSLNNWWPWSKQKHANAWPRHNKLRKRLARSIFLHKVSSAGMWCSGCGFVIW